MSAYLMNPEDIKAVVHWAESNGLLPKGLNRATTARAIGRVNLESVAYRYPDIAGQVAKAFLNMSDQQYLREIAEPFAGTPPSRSSRRPTDRQHRVPVLRTL
jgi:hypothetical protein